EQGEEAAVLDLEAESVDGRHILEALRHIDEPDVGDTRHLCRRVHDSARTSPRIETIWSNSWCPATSGGEIWMTGSPRSSARQMSPRSKSAGERKPRSSVSHSSSSKVCRVSLSFTSSMA